MYPNPVEANTLHLTYITELPGTVQLLILDLSGRVLLQQSEPVTPGEQVFSVNISSLAQGSYLLQLSDGERRGVRKVVVR